MRRGWGSPRRARPRFGQQPGTRTQAARARWTAWKPGSAPAAGAPPSAAMRTGRQPAPRRQPGGSGPWLMRRGWGSPPGAGPRFGKRPAAVPSAAMAHRLAASATPPTGRCLAAPHAVWLGVAPPRRASVWAAPGAAPSAAMAHRSAASVTRPTGRFRAVLHAAWLGLAAPRRDSVWAASGGAATRAWMERISATSASRSGSGGRCMSRSSTVGRTPKFR